MSATQFFPIPPELFSRACRTVTDRVSQLPFLRSGVTVTGEMLGVAMESLNAVPQKALAITTPRDAGSGMEDGLDRCLEERLRVPGTAAAQVIAEVLVGAGIAEPARIPNKHTHREHRGIRLVAPWTWHIASALAPSVRLGGAGDGPALSWMDVCPVCRTGILERVTGKQLFGVPRTDFYIECSSCGGKFIPVGQAYRLVSIATVRDPLWKSQLDKTRTPGEWAALARGPGPVKPPVQRPAAGKPETPVLPKPSVLLSTLKDGSLAVPVAGKILYFRPVPLRFSGSVRGDAFFRVQATLEELLARPAFSHLRPQVDAKYSRYLPLRAGIFLSQLKERHDPFYREFLNPYGDERYGTFRADDPEGFGKPGVLIVVVDRGLYHVLGSPDPVATTISSRLGRVGPDDCLLSGDPVRCRINALLCTNREKAELFFFAAEQEEERLSVIQGTEGVIAAGGR
ncbi:MULTISPECIES: hypothetical protein [unclassified Methanoregula]|uniref:hypothetical protein n=1 Tax=unclassified Methanoregula TaxID=2649730 RepID=UPI0025D02069|nr:MULTISPECIES: hypothetical protein [unclassified Methanoregula]